MNLFNNFIFLFEKIAFICGKKFSNKVYKLFFLSLFFAILEFIGLGLFITFIMSIFQNQNYIFDFFPAFNHLKYKEMILILFFFYTLKLILSSLFHFKLYTSLFNLHYELSNELFKKYLSRPYLFYTKTNSSTLVRNLYSELGAFVHQVLMAFSLLFIDLILIFIMIFLLMLNDVISTLITFSLLSLAYLSYYSLSKPFTKKWGKIFVNQKYLIHNSLKETFGSIKEIKIFNNEFFFNKRFSEDFLKFTKAARNQTISSYLPKLFFEYIIIIIFILILNLYIFQELPKEKIFTNLALFAAASIRLMPCFHRISVQTQSIIFYKPTVDILYKEFKELSNFNIDANKEEFLKEQKKFEFNTSIDLRNLDFYFSKDKKILQDVNFSIQKNQIVGIIGKSGEGKTTLVDIICGIVSPTKGEVLIDKKYNIHSFQFKKNWLRKIGYVTQDIYLLNDTIRNNILYGDEKFDKENYTMALQNSQFEEVIKNFEEKDNAIVGENGVNFSGGQKKRLAIARALYRNPELIIFDESTSSLDLENEKKIFQILGEVKKNRCIIIISHNKKTLEYCDKIFQLKNTNIFEEKIV